MNRVELISCLILLSVGNAWALENPSFEASDALHGWQSIVAKKGRDPVIRVDRREHVRGKQSLLVEASDPADIAVRQIVHLPPNSLWRAACWITTEDLKATDPTETGGTFHIRTIDNQLVAEAPIRLFGTYAWQKVAVSFRVPVSGEVQIVLFFVGFGRGTGKVWFDDVHLEEIAADSEINIVRSIENSSGAISLHNSSKVSIRLKNKIQLSCRTGLVVLADGTRLGPLDWSKAQISVEQSKDACGDLDKLIISEMLNESMRVTVTWSLYRDAPVVAIDMSVENETQRDMFLYRLIPLWGEPPIGGFSSDFPKWPACRFLQQPDSWSRRVGPRAIPLTGSASAFWSTVIGSTDATSLAIGIGETARGGSRIDFAARESRVGVKISTWLQTDLRGRKLRLPPNKTYVSHRMLLVTGANPHDALDRYTDSVCRFMNWQLRHPPYTGLFAAYGSDPTNKDPLKHPLSERRMLQLMRVVDKYLKPYGLETIKTQFCGYSSSRPDGRAVPKLSRDLAERPEVVHKLILDIRKKGFAPEHYDSRRDFRNGLRWHVRQLIRRGYRPALVCRPFYNIKAGDPALDQAAADLFEMTVKHWGYRYLMFDFIWHDYDSDNDTITVAQGISNRFRAIRERLGPEIFVEACMVWPGPVLGLADGYRPAEDWRGGLEDVLAPAFATRYFYHGRFFQCDSEFFDPALQPFTWGRGRAEHVITSEDSLRLWVSYNAMLGYSYLAGGALERVESGRWWIFQRGMPVQQGRAKALDLLDSNPPRQWIRECTTASGKYYLLGLFNWGKTEPLDLTIDLKDWGLPDNVDYLFFDFWNGQVHGPARDFTTRVAPFACRMLHVQPVSAQPSIVGNSRHVTGQAGIEQWHWMPEQKTLNGVLRGAPGSQESYWIWLPENEGIAKCSGAEVEVIGPHLIRLDICFDKSGSQSWELQLDKAIPIPL